MARTIKQLKADIAVQRAKIGKEQRTGKIISEKSKLSKQLFELKNRKIISFGKKAKGLSKRFGRGLLNVGKKAAPVIKKQARLIRDQQLRDDALARARSKRKKKIITRPKKIKPTDNIFGNLDF